MKVMLSSDRPLAIHQELAPIAECQAGYVSAGGLKRLNGPEADAQ